MDRWQIVESLFRDALEQPIRERRGWLQRACASDPELFREVSSLVLNHSDNDPGSWAAIAAAKLMAGPAASPGELIGHYELLEFIGAGGMGEVYRARDNKLGREVALKLLPAAFSQDADRLARFRREAQVLASLNHPNIGTLYGVEDGTLVMELVDGRTLAECIAVERFNQHQVLSVMRQVAEALEYAHEKGIVHRDLKPSNIKLTPDGRVKVLDFGLAKALGNAATDRLNLSPTIAVDDPTGGAIIGTAAYMAPEQARGVAVDKRADVWSFGVVLYELLSRQRAFQGDTAPETFVVILKRDGNAHALPENTAPALRRLLYRCLESDRRHRLRDMGDAILELDDAIAHPVEEHSGSRSLVTSRTGFVPFRVLTAAVALLAVAIVVTTAVLVRANRTIEYPLVRLNVDLGPNVVPGTSTTVIISRNGRRLVFLVRGATGKQQLATRLLDETQPTVLAGTEDATDPFFSPDGEWIAFFADAKLKKVSVQGGSPITLCTAVNPRGATWGENNNIIGAFNFSGPLVQVGDRGGTPQPISKLRPGEATQRWPQALPGGAIVFTASSNPIGHEDDDIEVLSLKTGQVKHLLHGGYFGRYLPSGHLLYVHQGVLFGVKFDAARLEVRGKPIPLVDDAAVNPITAGGQFDFSETPSGPGTLLYLAGASAARKWQVDWLDVYGHSQPLIKTPGIYTVPRVSPDGKQLAFIGGDAVPQIYDTERDTITRITSAGGGGNLAWAPDGKHVVFAYSGSLFYVRSDGVGGPQLLFQDQHSLASWSFSPDGHWLAYFEMGDVGSKIGVLPLNIADPDHPKAGEPLVFSQTQNNEIFPRFSPDGRWIAYRSDELGTNEIWVRPFPNGPGARYQISSSGAMYPFWSNNGHQLLYETADRRIMVVDYRVDGNVFKPGKPRLWSAQQIFYPGVSNMDIAPDGKRFAILTVPTAEAGSVHVAMLLNYFDELKRKLP